MSHCPGSSLEDWITDWHRLVDADKKHGSGWRWLYTGQLILTAEQFAELVKIYEPFRAGVEERLQEYNEEENGSWRDYAGYAFDFIPEPVMETASVYLKSIESIVPKTQGLAGGN